MNTKLTLLAGAVGVAGLGQQSLLAKAPAKDARPNIIVILCDDMGFSDMGCFGGEIQTPNLDGLAKQGMRFNSFYNTGKSCPTRASLLTGLYQHEAGVGRMTFDDHLEGYRGNLSHNAVTIAEVLKESGYNTAMVGKWHVALTPTYPDQGKWLAHQVERQPFVPIDNYPVNRGFDRHYGIVWGVADYFDPFSLVYGTEEVKEVPKDYYITQALSDTATLWVNDLAKQDKPFFMYLAYTAPHWPLHALPEDIAKYENTYTPGWKKIRDARYARMEKLGIFPGQKGLLTDPQSSDQWEENPTQEWDARAMAVHAAMIDRMDQGIGEMLKALKKSGKYDNTLIVFLSDNGCSAEWCQNYSAGENDRPGMLRNGETMIYPKDKKVMPGPQNVYASIGPHWANVANTPFRFWKGKSLDGGICAPTIMSWPKGMKSKVKGTVTSQRGHVMDLMATCVDLAGATYPKEYKGNQIKPLQGLSMAPVFKGEVRKPHDVIGFEHFNESALISADNWKIVRQGAKGNWELYDLNTDRTEKTNVAAKYPEKLAQMEALYEKWTVDCDVVPYPGQNKQPKKN